MRCDTVFETVREEDRLKDAKPVLWVHRCTNVFLINKASNTRNITWYCMEPSGKGKA